MGGWFDYIRMILGWKSSEPVAPVDTDGRTFERITQAGGRTCQISAGGGYSCTVTARAAYSLHISE